MSGDRLEREARMLLMALAEKTTCTTCFSAQLEYHPRGADGDPWLICRGHCACVYVLDQHALDNYRRRYTMPRDTFLPAAIWMG